MVCMVNLQAQNINSMIFSRADKLARRPKIFLTNDEVKLIPLMFLPTKKEGGPNLKTGVPNPEKKGGGSPEREK